MIQKTFLSLALLAVIAAACFDPMDKWVTGILFNNGETIDLSAVFEMGEDGVNYIKEGEGTAVKIQYTSHYSTKALVSLGRFSTSFQTDTSMPRLAIALDTAVKPESFAFEKAVAGELDWLVAKKVLNISPSKLEKIKAGLGQVSGGNKQYWTKQDSALSYNSWFGEGGVDGVFGVRGAKGTNSCGSGVSFTALPQQLKETAGIRARQPLQKPLHLAVQAAGDGYFFHWNTGRKTKNTIHIATLSGRTLVHRSFNHGVNQWFWDGKCGQASNAAPTMAIVALQSGQKSASRLIAIPAGGSTNVEHGSTTRGLEGRPMSAPEGLPNNDEKASGPW